MPTPTAPARERTPLDLDGVLTIGQLAARTGLTPEVLRMWETRHGFPVPVRLPSGHRRYTDADVDDVLRVLRLREGGVHLDQKQMEQQLKEIAPPAGDDAPPPLKF